MVRRSLAALAIAALLVTSGCGSGTSPADDVPALPAALDRVDEAIADEDYDAARDAVAELTDVATKAEESGDLDAEQADRIVSAGESLMAAFPGTEDPAPQPEPSSPTSSAPADEDEGEDEGDEDDEESSPGPPEHAEKPDKEPKEPKGKEKD